MKKTSTVIAFALLAACTPPEEKVNKLMTAALTECRASEGPFYGVSVVGGRDDILKDVCAMPVEGLKIVEEFSAVATVGPYKINAGIDDSTGVWMLSGVRWNELGKAQRTTEDGVETGAREQGLPLWKAVQEKVPQSTWIREQRFNNVLALRKKTRGRDKDPVGLGPAQTVYDEMVKWAKEKDQNFEQHLYVQVTKYHKDQSEKLELSLENIGSQDEWLESLIKQARKDKNKKDQQAYQKDLDDSRAGRDAKIEGVEKKVKAAADFACAESAKITVGNIEDEALRKNLASARAGLGCP